MEFSSTNCKMRILAGFLACILVRVHTFTDENDFKILNDFVDGLSNPELLKWPENGDDPCGPPAWPHLVCSNGRVTQIQVQNLGLEGPLPPNLNQLEKLENVGLQRNRFNGDLPSFSGLSNLQFAYLDFNEFETIPLDFFNGLSSIRVLALDDNPFNKSSGWIIPSELAECSQLVNFSCSSCNIVGPLPDFFGKFPSLDSLRLSYNRLSGAIPSTFSDSMLQVLWLNDQDGDGMTGPIDVIATLLGLTVAWLHGNHFSGPIPDGIGRLTSLRELNLNRNRLVGLIPAGLANMNLHLLNLNNNMLMGPIPKFKAANVSYAFNSFCQSDEGEPCAPEVNALLDFLRDVDYPERLASEWSGNDPCAGPWWGISCSLGKVSVVNLQKLRLNGTLSPSLGNLSSLLEVHLEGNDLHGRVPASLAQLGSLRLLNLSGSKFEPPLPRFRDGVRVIIDGFPPLQPAKPPAKPPKQSPSPAALPQLPPSSPDKGPRSPSHGPSSGNDQQPSKDAPPSSSKAAAVNEQKNASSIKSGVAMVAAVVSVVSLLLAGLLVVCYHRRRRRAAIPASGFVVHPRESPDSGDTTKISVVKCSAVVVKSGGLDNSTKVSEAGKLLIPLEELRKVTNNFAQENELGRGGFGVVYKGMLDDGTRVAVKRMVVAAVSNKALDEFQSEIAVLSNVRHRHLVTLVGYSAEGDERLLVYEYLPQGALSRHLFRWSKLGLAPLSWTTRLVIALDVARGVEYLHSLAQHSFIHRDLKSSNILLDDDFRAKVSDFGLVKLAPDRESSIPTKLAGTFGYLAPEYAVTGKITTKVDVFSFGVVLMELLTGLVALDEQRGEENRYLAEWFWQMKSDKRSLIASLDPALEAKEDMYDTIYTIAELAGHCTARDPNHRPEMGHAVNVLAQSLAGKWEPCKESDEFCGINMSLPLSQMLKRWQEEAADQSQDSKGSIPAKPSGFADSFTSADAR
ncbi:receptor protein kinase TMK1-like [Salvia miltiorrhiza]|uniref:receptor protein kinase TMK1-like n=1 Tax=Salvia miltiorrhiza TaxID=226208 RepID=UPI0025ABCD4B|nr:receptor protein kinase TMK1-like [Salvia miltiorrhiza]